MTYTYKCRKCLHVQEEEHGMKEYPVVYCPRDGEQMVRVIQGGGSVLFPMSSRSRGVT
jgi:predicted nucleic acid-binding Zn ribbon protein